MFKNVLDPVEFTLSTAYAALHLIKLFNWPSDDVLYVLLVSMGLPTCPLNFSLPYPCHLLVTEIILENKR